MSESDSPQPTSYKHFFCGFTMGLADAVPGISGGTVALILGIYERLVTAISRCDTTFFKLVFTGRWLQAAKHIDLLFLVVLMAGILGGIACFSHVVMHLLENHLIGTFAAFFGLILASVIFIFRSLRTRDILAYLGILGGAAFGWWIVSLDALSGSDALHYVFFSGVIAICAMILPGISGSYLLIILGEYHIVLERVHLFTKFQASPQDVMILVVFAVGCALGLIMFSKLLKWLLRHYHDITMAVMCGCMLGSLRSLWPFQEMVRNAEGKADFQMLDPATLVATDYATAAIAAVAGFILLFVLEGVAARFGEK